LALVPSRSQEQTPPLLDPLPLAQSETRDEDDIATAFSEFSINPVAKKVSGVAIAEASASTAKAEAQAEEAKSPAARFGGRALPGMPMGMSPAAFKLPGLGEKK
jgi:hypothetical protein